jgi:hypothetical protein
LGLNLIEYSVNYKDEIIKSIKQKIQDGHIKKEQVEDFENDYESILKRIFLMKGRHVNFTETLTQKDNLLSKFLLFEKIFDSYDNRNKNIICTDQFLHIDEVVDHNIDKIYELWIHIVNLQRVLISEFNIYLHVLFTGKETLFNKV